jgi:hypothetical protein
MSVSSGSSGSEEAHHGTKLGARRVESEQEQVSSHLGIFVVHVVHIRKNKQNCNLLSQ